MGARCMPPFLFVGCLVACFLVARVWAQVPMGPGSMQVRDSRNAPCGSPALADVTCVISVVYLCTYKYVCTCVNMAVYLPVCLLVYLFVSVSICLSLCLFICLSDCPSICQSVCKYVCMM